MAWDEQVFVFHAVYPLFLHFIKKKNDSQPLNEGEVDFRYSGNFIINLYTNADTLCILYP